MCDWALGKSMAKFLILVSPLTFLICGWIVYLTARATGGARWGLFAGLVYFTCLGAIRGPFEFTFGFHIDTIAGPTAVAMALLVWRDEVGRSEWISAGAIALLCLFVLLKEEMALL